MNGNYYKNTKEHKDTLYQREKVDKVFNHMIKVEKLSCEKNPNPIQSVDYEKAQYYQQKVFKST